MMTDAPRPTVPGRLPGIAWPALPAAPAEMLAALTAELEATQWWSPEQLARHQATQRALVVAHAARTVPHYAGLDPDDWARVPVLTRADVIAAGPRLTSRAYPAAHGPVGEAATSRSTGEPVRVRTTGVTTALWHAITLREHRWHARDLGAHLAAIRYVGDAAPPPDGLRARGWGPATAALAPDAPLSVLSVRSTTDEQIAWLARTAPDYLLVYPSVLDAILRRLVATGARLPPLRQVRTISEVLAPETRALCAEVLGAPIADVYSAQEVGYVALECPHGAPGARPYHLMSERHVVEILRDDGAPCAVGETGRVVVTDLHNFATPLLRYDLGDWAEVGAPCPCGRGLPTIRRLVGRRRNMLTYPDGRTVWPVFALACRAAARYHALQLVQVTRDALIARVVAERGAAFGARERAALTEALHACLGHPFAVEVEVVDELARTPAGKLEEFVSRVLPGAA